VFLAKGYPATSFKDIADAVGLDRATLYYYFASKQEIFQAATRAGVVRNTTSAEAVAASAAPAADKVAEIFRLLLDSYTSTDWPYMFIFLQEDPSRISSGPDDPWASEVTELSRRYESAVTKVFADGAAAGVFAADLPPHVLTKIVLGMGTWTHQWYRKDGPMTAAQLADVFSRVVLHGVTVAGS
jgi:AcrR family transcriptional regulator